MPDVPTQIQQLLEQNLTIHTIEIRDDSHHHAGHAEAAAHGGGHYTLTLSSPDFANLTRLQQQRRVNDILAPLFAANAIHALRLRLSTPTD